MSDDNSYDAFPDAVIPQGIGYKFFNLEGMSEIKEKLLILL